MEKERIYKELTKLPALLRERVPYGAFDMRYMFSHNGEKDNGEKDMYEARKHLIENHDCGTAACVWGWSQVFSAIGVLDFDPIAFIDSNSRQFITYSGWAEHATEHTLEAACARIEYVVAHGGAPDNWRNQVCEFAPVSYR